MLIVCGHASCRRDAFTLDMMEIPQGAGSGFVWDTKGHIVTNYHVIKGASDLQACMSPGSQAQGCCAWTSVPLCFV